MGTVQSERHTIDLRFPRGQMAVTAEECTPAVAQRFPGFKHLTMVSVRLIKGATVSVVGFGMPFRNPEAPEVEAWVNQNAPIEGGIALLDFLRQRTFHFILPAALISVEKEWNDQRLPPPFSYPYGTEHQWPPDVDGEPDLRRHQRLLEENKSAEAFPPAFRQVSIMASFRVLRASC
jgi:hypothetical protein